MHFNPALQRFASLALDRLAFARGERVEEVVEGRVVRVLPMELLIVALEVAELAEKPPFVFRCERDMHRGGVAQICKFDEAARQPVADRFAEPFN